MNDPIREQPAAIVQAGESTPVLVSLLKAEHAQFETVQRANIQRAKKMGDMLLELARRCKHVHGEWTKHLQAIGLSSGNASRYMRIAENWDKLSHPATINQAMKMLAEDVAEPPTVVTPPANAPLCPKCARLARTGQSPTKGCKDCKAVRESDEAARRAAETGAPQYEEGAEDEAGGEEEGSEEESPNPAAGLTETPPPKPKGGKGGKPPKSGAPIIGMTEVAALTGQYLKAIDNLAHNAGLKKGNKTWEADSVIETPDTIGFRRILEELKDSVKKWLKRIKHPKAEE